MVDAAICDGDYVVIRQEQTAENGEIVAALIDGEATVKTFQRKDGKVWLLPHNDAYEPIDGTNASILGKVTAVLRSRLTSDPSGSGPGPLRGAPDAVIRRPRRSSRGDASCSLATQVSTSSTDVGRGRGSACGECASCSLLAVLYVAYSGTRLFANDALAPAVDRAHALVDVERSARAGLGACGQPALRRRRRAGPVRQLLVRHRPLPRHRRRPGLALPPRPGDVPPARRALLLATVLGLVLYLLLPMAPPRLSRGYVDVLSLHSADGWWGSEASAPRGLGGFTNQLAAFPSLHAGLGAVGGAGDPERHDEPGLRARSAGPTRPSRRSSWSAPATTGCSTPSSAGWWSGRPGGSPPAACGTGRPNLRRKPARTPSVRVQ